MTQREQIKGVEAWLGRARDLEETASAWRTERARLERVARLGKHRIVFRGSAPGTFAECDLALLPEEAEVIRRVLDGALVKRLRDADQALARHMAAKP